jgi:hypothetical protein
MIVRSTSTHSVVFQWVYHHDGAGGGEASSPYVEACSERRLRRPSSPHIGFSYGTPRLGAILQQSVGKHPQGIRLGNSHDHGAYP